MQISRTLYVSLAIISFTLEPALAIELPRKLDSASVHAHAIQLAAYDANGKKNVQIRSIGFLTRKLKERHFDVIDARRHGFLYFVRVRKDGYKALMTIDGRSADIVGIKVLEAPAGAKRKPKDSAGRHFVDITYEFGYTIEISTYETYKSYTEHDYSSTESYSHVYMSESEITTESSEVSSYEADVTSQEAEIADLDHGDPGDEAGNAEMEEPASALPDETPEEAAAEPSDGSEEE